MTNQNCYLPPWKKGEGPQYTGNGQEVSQSQALNKIEKILNQLYDLFSIQGVLDFFESSVDSNGTTLTPQLPYERWVKISIENTGSNDLYFKINGKSSDSKVPYVSPGGTFSFDIGKNVIMSAELHAAPNTTTSYRVYAVK